MRRRRTAVLSQLVQNTAERSRWYDIRGAWHQSDKTRAAAYAEEIEVIGHCRPAGGIDLASGGTLVSGDDRAAKAQLTGGIMNAAALLRAVPGNRAIRDFKRAGRMRNPPTANTRFVSRDRAVVDLTDESSAADSTSVSCAILGNCAVADHKTYQ